MLSAFLISLREGVEAALIVGICLAYLRKIERPELERVVWWAVAAALAASLAGAALLEQVAVNQEGLEGFLMLLAAVLLVTMIIWMRRVARSLRREIEGEVARWAGQGRFAAVGLFAFVAAMVLREGIETVVFLRALSAGSQGLLLLAGTVLGLGLAIALAIFFFKGTLPIRLDRFFDATSLMLVVIAVQLTLTGIHELSEAFILPSGPWMMRVLGPIVRNDVFFFVILLALAGWLVLRELVHRRQVPEGLSQARQAALRVERERQHRWMAATAATALLVLVALTAEHVYAGSDAELPVPVPVEASSATVRIPVANVNDGALHHFRFTHERSSVGFLVIRRPDGRLAVALEACTICGPHGYYQRGDAVVCKNCEAEIPVAFIDTPGGCNPVPLHAWIEGDTLVIPVSALAGGAHFFKQD